MKKIIIAAMLLSSAVTQARAVKGLNHTFDIPNNVFFENSKKSGRYTFRWKSGKSKATMSLKKVAQKTSNKLISSITSKIEGDLYKNFRNNSKFAEVTKKVVPTGFGKYVGNEVLFEMNVRGTKVTIYSFVYVLSNGKEIWNLNPTSSLEKDSKLAKDILLSMSKV